MRCWMCALTACRPAVPAVSPWPSAQRNPVDTSCIDNYDAPEFSEPAPCPTSRRCRSRTARRGRYAHPRAASSVAPTGRSKRLRMIQNNWTRPWPRTRISSSSTAASARPRATAGLRRHPRCAPRLRPDETLLCSPASRWASSAPTPARRACSSPTRSRAQVGHLGAFQRARSAGLMMYGQMTAGSWNLHRHPRHRARHLREFAEAGASTTAVI